MGLLNSPGVATKSIATFWVFVRVGFVRVGMWGGMFFYDRENGRGGAKFWLVVSVPGFPYVSHRFHFLWASILVQFFGPQLSRTFFGPQFSCTCLDLDSLPRMYKQLREPQTPMSLKSTPGAPLKACGAKLRSLHR